MVYHVRAGDEFSGGLGPGLGASEYSAFRATRPDKVLAWHLLERPVFRTDDRDLCSTAYILNQRIIIAVTVNSVGFGDELFCGFSTRVAGSELPTCNAALPGKVVRGRLLERSVVGTDDNRRRVGALIVYLRVIVAITVHSLRLVDKRRCRVFLIATTFRTSVSS